METDGSGAVARRAAVPTVDTALCTGCGRCVAACPEKIITLDVSGHRKTAVIRNPQRCTRCLRCIESCPVAAFDKGDGG